MEPMLSASKSVAMALMVGSSAVRTRPQTRVGRVLPLPMVKKVMTKSSSDSERAMSAAPTSAWPDQGQGDGGEGLERRGAKVARAFDQRPVEGRKPRMQDGDDEGQDHHELPETTVGRPSGIESTRTKNESRATPMTSAGSIIGALKHVEEALRRGARLHAGQGQGRQQGPLRRR